MRADAEAEMTRILLFGSPGGGNALYFPFCPLASAENNYYIVRGEGGDGHGGWDDFGTGCF